jgi:hypothetical protein
MEAAEALTVRFLAWQVADLAIRAMDVLPPPARGKGYRENLAASAELTFQVRSLPFPRWPFETPDPFEA